MTLLIVPLFAAGISIGGIPNAYAGPSVIGDSNPPTYRGADDSVFAAWQGFGICVDFDSNIVSPGTEFPEEPILFNAIQTSGDLFDEDANIRFEDQLPLQKVYHLTMPNIVDDLNTKNVRIQITTCNIFGLEDLPPVQFGDFDARDDGEPVEVFFDGEPIIEPLNGFTHFTQDFVIHPNPDIEFFEFSIPGDAELVSVIVDTVSFGEDDPLETEKFYTTTNVDIEEGNFGEPLPFRDGTFVHGTNDSQVVSAVVHPKKGTINGYTPGQYYAVTKVTALQDLDEVKILEDDTACTEGDQPISKMNPNRVPGGAYVALMCDGVSLDISSELAHSDPPGLFINDGGNVEAHVEDVPEGCMVYLGVKYSPGLKGQIAEEVFGKNRSCENWEFVEAVTVDGQKFEDSAHRVLEVTGLPELTACDDCPTFGDQAEGECLEAGGSEEECSELRIEVINQCQLTCEPSTCDDCQNKWEAALGLCLDEGGSEDECVEASDEVRALCEDCIGDSCEPPQPDFNDSFCACTNGNQAFAFCSPLTCDELSQGCQERCGDVEGVAVFTCDPSPPFCDFS